MNAVALTFADLPTGLRRAAGEPARVFGCRDWRDEQFPVEYIDMTNRWLGPAFWPWAIRQRVGVDRDSVVVRSLDRYGLQARRGDASVMALGLCMEAPGIPAKPTRLGEVSLKEHQVLVVTVTSFDGGTHVQVPATPVAYCLRRWGDDGQWTIVDNGGNTDERRCYVRFSIAGEPLAVIAAIHPQEGNA